MAWTQVLHLAEIGAAGVQHPQANSLDHLSRRLVMTAAIVATLQPDLGQDWVHDAASIASTATRSRRGLFFTELARGLRGLCDEPSDALNDMQRRALRFLVWFDSNGGRERFRGRPPKPIPAAPDPPPPAEGDAEIADDSEIAAAVRAALYGTIGKQRSELWFGPAH